MTDATPEDTNLPIAALAQQLVDARADNTAYPLLTPEHPSLDMPAAYAIQQAFVATQLAQGERISGYKAALTAAAAQQAMGIDAPVVGVLFESGEHLASQTSEIAASGIPGLLLETELGFRLSEPVSRPITSIEQLQSIIQSVHPTLELASMGFGEGKPTGVDMVASNSASRAYLVGDPLPLDKLDLEHDLDNLTVDLARDGSELHCTSSGSLMQGQWSALQWLVNTTLANGYTIEPGQLLMTGSIGGVHPAQPGRHTSQYGALATLSLQITS